MQDPHRQLRHCLEQAAINDRLADKVANAAQGAEGIGHAALARHLWAMARRRRVESLKLRAQALTFRLGDTDD